MSVVLTAVSPSASGYLDAAADLTSPPNLQSYLNYTVGTVAVNTAIVPVGSNGQIKFRASSATDLVIDVQGYYSAGTPGAGAFVPIVPARFVDSRSGLGTPSRMTAGSTRTLQFGGRSDVPADSRVPSGATSVAVNITIVNPAGAGSFTLFPANEASSPVPYNFTNAAATSVGTIAELSPSGALKLKLASTSADIVVDVVGYFKPGVAGGAYGFARGRALDTRDAPAVPIPGNGMLDVQVGGIGDIPPGAASAFDIHVAVTSGSTAGYVTLWPGLSTEPATSTLNYAPSSTLSNNAIVAASSNDRIRIRNHGSQPIHVILDVEGWFARPEAPPSIIPSDVSVAPCAGACSATHHATSSLTPTLRAVPTDRNSASVSSSFQIREALTGDIVATSPEVSRPQGQAAEWQVPAGALVDDTLYEFRVLVSDATSTVSTLWDYIGLEVNDAPLPPANPAVQPCDGPCDNFATASRTPLLTAEANDEDSSFLASKFELRPLGGEVIEVSEDPILPANSLTSYQVPEGALEVGQYQYRVTLTDQDSSTTGEWINFIVEPGDPQVPEPIDFRLTSCATGLCADWVSNTATPTFQARIDPDAAGPMDLVFEARDEQAASGDVVNLVPGAMGSWTVPAGAMGPGVYEARVGARNPSGTTWLAWMPVTIDIDPGQGPDFPSLEEGVEDAHLDTSDAPEPFTYEEDLGYTFGDAESDALDAQNETAYLKELAEGVAAPDAALNQETRDVPVWDKYAPILYLHGFTNNGVRYLNDKSAPVEAKTQLAHSDLFWDDPNCKDTKLTKYPKGWKMAAGDYEFNTFKLASDMYPPCSILGPLYASNDYVGPWRKGGPTGRSGMYLQVNNGLADGSFAPDPRFDGGEDVYRRYTCPDEWEGSCYIEYFFNYGSSTTISVSHEGDWESIAILIGPDGIPDIVQYFYHRESCILKWRDVPKRNRVHPGIAVAWNSHGSYPVNSNPEDVGPGMISYDDTINDQGPKWYARPNLKSIRNQGWYGTDASGYGGGWGQSGDNGDGSGPLSPGPARAYDNKEDPPDFSDDDCEF